MLSSAILQFYIVLSKDIINHVKMKENLYFLSNSLVMGCRTALQAYSISNFDRHVFFGQGVDAGPPPPLPL